MAIDKSLLTDLGTEKLTALIETMFLAAMADEELGEDEVDALAAKAAELAGDRLAGDAIDALLAQTGKTLDDAARKAKLEEVRVKLPEPELRKLALGLAIEVTAADGIIRTSERELILETAELLEIDRDEAADLVKSVTG